MDIRLIKLYSRPKACLPDSGLWSMFFNRDIPEHLASSSGHMKHGSSQSLLMGPSHKERVLAQQICHAYTTHGKRVRVI